MTIYCISLNDPHRKQFDKDHSYNSSVGPIGGTIEDLAFFHPTWEMVKGHKHWTGDQRYTSYKKVSTEEYTDQYRTIIMQNRVNIKGWLERLDLTEDICILCWCPPNAQFCHRHLIAKVIEKWLPNAKVIVR